MLEHALTYQLPSASPRIGDQNKTQYGSQSNGLRSSDISSSMSSSQAGPAHQLRLPTNPDHQTIVAANNVEMSFQILLPSLEEPFIRPTKSDWERLKPYICQSYRGQHTVRQIREALTASGYGVSERMLKARLAKWDMTHKNNTFKPHHVRAIIRKGQQYVDQGQRPPVFIINGRKRTYDDAVKLFCRWKRTDSPPSQHSSSSPESDQPLTPVDMIELEEDAEEIKRDEIIHAFSGTETIHRAPNMSVEDLHTDRTLASVRNWYQDYGPITLDQEAWHHCCPIYSLLENCMTAMQSAQTFGVTSQWDALRELQEKAELSVTRISTSSFLNALRWFSLFPQDTTEGSVSQVVLKMLAQVALQQLGENHPISLLFGSVASTPVTPKLVWKLWSATQKTVVSSIEGAAQDDFNGHSLVRVGAIMTNLGEYDLASHYLEEAEQVGVSASEWKVLGCTRWMKGRLLRCQENYDSSISVLEEHATFLREHDMEGTFLGIAVQEELAKCNASLDRWDEAAGFFGEAVRLVEENSPNNLTRKVQLLNLQDDALLKQGKKDESFALQAEHPDAFRIS